MIPENFAYWLQGYFELLDDPCSAGLTSKQAKTIADHLRLVFEKATSDRRGSDLKKELEKMFEDDTASASSSPSLFTRPRVYC